MSIAGTSSIGERVALLARAAGSLRRLDRAAGLKLGHCQQIATGAIKSVQVETADSIARATGSTLVWLIRGEGRAPDLATVRTLVRQSCGDEVDEVEPPADDIGTAPTLPPPGGA